MEEKNIFSSDENFNLEKKDLSQYVVLVNNLPEYDIEGIKKNIFEEAEIIFNQMKRGRIFNPLETIDKIRKIKINLKYTKILKEFLDSLDKNLEETKIVISEMDYEDREIIIKAMKDSLLQIKFEFDNIMKDYSLEYNKTLFIQK